MNDDGLGILARLEAIYDEAFDAALDLSGKMARQPRSIAVTQAA
jgi:hypothetical protein